MKRRKEYEEKEQRKAAREQKKERNEAAKLRAERSEKRKQEAVCKKEEAAKKKEEAARRREAKGETMKIKQIPVYHVRDVTMLLVLSATRGYDALKVTITENPLMKGQFLLLNYCVLLVQVQDTTQ